MLGGRSAARLQPCRAVSRPHQCVASYMYREAVSLSPRGIEAAKKRLSTQPLPPRPNIRSDGRRAAAAARQQKRSRAPAIRSATDAPDAHPAQRAKSSHQPSLQVAHAARAARSVNPAIDNEILMVRLVIMLLLLILLLILLLLLASADISHHRRAGRRNTAERLLLRGADHLARHRGKLQLSDRSELLTKEVARCVCTS